MQLYKALLSKITIQILLLNVGSFTFTLDVKESCQLTWNNITITNRRNYIALANKVNKKLAT